MEYIHTLCTTNNNHHHQYNNDSRIIAEEEAIYTILHIDHIATHINFKPTLGSRAASEQRSLR